MRLKIEGKHSVEDTLQIIRKQLDHLIKQGMVDMSGVNVYLTPLDPSGEEIVFIDDQDQTIGMMIWRDVIKKKEVKVDRKKVAVQHPKPALRSVA